MQKARSYEDLLVWQKAMDLAESVYVLVRRLPKEELHVLSSQIKRAAVSVPSNIAEGQARSSTKELINFLYIARGSNAELQTQLFLCVRLGYFTDTEICEVLDLSREVGKMLNAFIASLKNK